MSVAMLIQNNVRVLERGNMCVEFSEDWSQATVTISLPTYEKIYNLPGQLALEWLINRG